MATLIPMPGAPLAQMRLTAPESVADMILGGGLSTKIVLGVLAAFSLASWVIIFWKLGQYRRLRKQGVRFLQAMERTPRLEDAYKSVTRLPESPYTRVFRAGINFFSELRPGALKEDAPSQPGLSEAQLHALQLVLEKEQGEERDMLTSGLQWLAIIGTVSPLLGLLGTVIGVMDAFLGITAASWKASRPNSSAPSPGKAGCRRAAWGVGVRVALPAQ